MMFLNYHWLSIMEGVSTFVPTKQTILLFAIGHNKFTYPNFPFKLSSIHYFQALAKKLSLYLFMGIRSPLYKFLYFVFLIYLITSCKS